MLLVGQMPVGHVDEKDRLKTFLEQAESPISVISWHSGKLARVARSSNSAELQAAADAEGELSYIRLSLRELVGETIPLQRWQEAAATLLGGNTVWTSMDTFGCTAGRLHDQGSEEAQKPFELLKRRGWKWRLVYDPSFTSARKRAQKGHDVLDYLPSSRTEEEFS